MFHLKPLPGALSQEEAKAYKRPVKKGFPPSVNQSFEDLYSGYVGNTKGSPVKEEGLKECKNNLRLQLILLLCAGANYEQIKKSEETRSSQKTAAFLRPSTALLKVFLSYEKLSKESQEILKTWAGLNHVQRCQGKLEFVDTNCVPRGEHAGVLALLESLVSGPRIMKSEEFLAFLKQSKGNFPGLLAEAYRCYQAMRGCKKTIDKEVFASHCNCYRKVILFLITLGADYKAMEQNESLVVSQKVFSESRGPTKLLQACEHFTGLSYEQQHVFSREVTQLLKTPESELAAFEAGKTWGVLTQIARSPDGFSDIDFREELMDRKAATSVSSSPFQLRVSLDLSPAERGSDKKPSNDV